MLYNGFKLCSLCNQPTFSNSVLLVSHFEDVGWVSDYTLPWYQATISFTTITSNYTCRESCNGAFCIIRYALCEWDQKLCNNCTTWKSVPSCRHGVQWWCPCVFCSNLHMLLALARETPQVLAQLGISMAMLQKEQEDLQNVEKLKVGWFTEETQGGGGGGARPSSSYKLPLFSSLVFSYQTCFVCPWPLLQSTWKVLVLACNISAYMWNLYHAPQRKCMLSQVTMVAFYCATYVHELKLWFMAQRHRVHTGWIPIRRYWPLRMSSTVLVPHHV